MDHEFGFRVRECGFIVVVSEESFLIHVPGSPREYSFLGGDEIQSNSSQCDATILHDKKRYCDGTAVLEESSNVEP